MNSLKQKTVSGVKWQVVSKILQKVISVGTFVVLARILDPSDFGLFAMAFVMINGLFVFEGLGLDAGVVQKKDLSDAMKHTAFFMMLALGLLVFALCYVLAPYAASFFNSKALTPMVQVLGVIFVLSSLARVPKALLTKDMKFNRIASTQLLASIVNAIAAVTFALYLKNAWCLVWAYLIKQVLIACFFWYFSGYRPRIEFNFQLAKELLHFGKFLSGLSLLWYLAINLNNIVVGRILGTTLLGFFALASNIGNFINTHFVYLLSGVLFPAYASIQDDPQALKRVFLKTTKFVSIFSMPFSIALILLAEELVMILYGSKWMPIVPLIQLFGFMQLVVPLVACSGPVFIGCGRPKIGFVLSFGALCIRIPLLIFFTMKLGIVGAALSEVIVRMLFAPISIFAVRMIIPFGWQEYLKQLYPAALCSAIMLGIVIFFKTIITAQDLHYILQFGALSIVGFVIYIAAFFCIDKVAIKELKNMVLISKG